METKKYIILNKPKQVLSSIIDQRGRKTVIDFICREDREVLIAGRLDYDSRGLMILTNDGLLINAITNPVKNIQKEYMVTVNKPVSEDDLENMRKGVIIDGRKVSLLKIRADGIRSISKTIKITITEGKKRELRRVLEFFGYHVIDLKRIRIGNIKLEDLKEGEYRYMTDDEVNSLKNLAGLGV